MLADGWQKLITVAYVIHAATELARTDEPRAVRKVRPDMNPNLVGEAFVHQCYWRAKLTSS